MTGQTSPVERERARIVQGIRSMQAVLEGTQRRMKGLVLSSTVCLGFVYGAIELLVWLSSWPLWAKALMTGGGLVVTFIGFAILHMMIAGFTPWGVIDFEPSREEGNERKIWNEFERSMRTYVSTWNPPKQLAKGWKVCTRNTAVLTYEGITYTVDFKPDVPIFSVPDSVLPEDQRMATDPSVLFARVQMVVADKYDLTVQMALDTSSQVAAT